MVGLLAYVNVRSFDNQIRFSNVTTTFTIPLLIGISTDPVLLLRELVLKKAAVSDSKPSMRRGWLAVID